MTGYSCRVDERKIPYPDKRFFKRCQEPGALHHKRGLYDIGWGFPAFVPDTDEMDVAAKLLEVTPETLVRLDALKGYPKLYGGETVPAKLTDGSVPQAMACVMRKLPEGMRVVESGNWWSLAVAASALICLVIQKHPLFC
ncbi:MAG: gamma-glutamylcyclotransferase [Saccharofermentanales bacterium]